MMGRETSPLRLRDARDWRDKFGLKAEVFESSNPNLQFLGLGLPGLS
jgi:hypothetical protein